MNHFIHRLAPAIGALLLPLLAAAQQAQAPAKQPAPAKPPAAKAEAKPAAKPQQAKAPARSPSRVEAHNKAEQMAAGIRAAEDALSPAELAIAERVHVGKVPCELGANVSLSADEKLPGYFDVQHGKTKFRMVPVTTSTGAIRLEDQKAGAVWLQLANKSMLMNQKLGQRLADECMSPQQMAVAEALKTNPAPSILDAPKPAPVPTAAASAASAANAPN